MFQARIVAYSDSDEEDFNRNRKQAATESDSDDEHTASPVDHDTATVNVKQKQLIRRPPPGNKVSIEPGPSVAAVAGFCSQHVTPKIERILVPQTAVRVGSASITLFACTFTTTFSSGPEHNTVLTAS